MPTVEAWQRGIGSHGFEVNLDTSCELATNEGFWPATYRGRVAGFELQCGSPDEFLPENTGINGDFDVAVSFVTHSNMDEGCSAWLAAAALAHMTGGVLVDESAGEHVLPADVIAWARAVEEEAAR